MRYKMNPMLKMEFDKRQKEFREYIKDRSSVGEDEISAALLELAEGWFEIGFDEGCEACAPLSPTLTNIYKDDKTSTNV